jgi:hypothetical protein
MTMDSEFLVSMLWVGPLAWPVRVIVQHVIAPPLVVLYANAVRDRSRNYTVASSAPETAMVCLKTRHVR